MTLMINTSQMPNCEIVTDKNLLEGSAELVEAKVAYGNEISLLVGKFPPGYKSRPHVQGSEQLSYLAEGELWVFVEGNAYHVGPGDFIRIPNMAVHWMWNPSPFSMHSTRCLTSATRGFGRPRLNCSAKRSACPRTCRTQPG